MDTDVSSSCSSNSNSLIVDNNDFIDMRVASSSSTKGTKSTAKEFQGVVRILLVDYDLVFLHVMLRMFKMFNYYEAVGVRGGSAGLKLLREKPCYFDLVMTAVYMPGMSGHELFRRIKEEFTTLPVILVSSDVDSIKASKGMSNVVGHFLHKPITCSDVEKMWQYVHKSKVDHVVNENRYNKQTGSSVEQDSSHNQEKNRNISGSTSSDDEGNSRVESRKRKESQKGQPSDNKRNRTRTDKTQRVVWTERLHTHFLNAIESLGVDYAVPKKILEFMKVPGLTRENVASHLQKYRLFMKGIVERNQNIKANTAEFLSSGAFMSNFASGISAMNMQQTDAPQQSITLPCQPVTRINDFKGLTTDQNRLYQCGASTLNTSSSGGYNNVSFQFGKSSMCVVENTRELLATSAKQPWSTSNNNQYVVRVSQSQANNNVSVGGGRSGKGTMEMVHRRWRRNVQSTTRSSLNLGTHSMIDRFNLQRPNNAEMVRNEGTTGNMGSSSIGSFSQALTSTSNNFIGIQTLNNNNDYPETLHIGPTAHELSNISINNSASNLDSILINKTSSSVMEVSNQMLEFPNMSSSGSTIEVVPNFVPQFPGTPSSISATEVWDLGHKYDLTDHYPIIESEEVTKLIPKFSGITTAEAPFVGGILNVNPQQETTHPPAPTELKETEVDQEVNNECDPFEGLFDLARSDSNFGMDSLPPLLDGDDFTDFLENFEQSTIDQGGAMYDGENPIDPSFDISMYIK